MANTIHSASYNHTWYPTNVPFNSFLCYSITITAKCKLHKWLNVVKLKDVLRICITGTIYTNTTQRVLNNTLEEWSACETDHTKIIQILIQFQYWRSYLDQSIATTQVIHWQPKFVQTHTQFIKHVHSPHKNNLHLTYHTAHPCGLN